MLFILNLPDARKKYWESPWIPMVPGPDMSAKTLTNENAPLMIPNPSPETESKCEYIHFICKCSDKFSNAQNIVVISQLLEQLHAYQSISFIAYTNGAKFFVSCFSRTKFKNWAVLYIETLIELLDTDIAFCCHGKKGILFQL